MINNTEERAPHILEQLKQDKRLWQYVDSTLHIPKPYYGLGEIKLIVLGQDPTVKNAESRRHIKTVLNLDKNRSVRAYLAGVCNGLGIDIKENVYATNLYKNFFIHPPTQIAEIDIFEEFAEVWFPFLNEELAQFGNIPIITLGQPILAPLVGKGIPIQVRHYWGYIPEWKTKPLHPFQYIKPEDNKLNRIIFPFPHQPSLRKQFYKAKMSDYISYVKATLRSKLKE
jgi:hypothetical protein